MTTTGAINERLREIAGRHRREADWEHVDREGFRDGCHVCARHRAFYAEVDALLYAALAAPTAPAAAPAPDRQRVGVPVGAFSVEVTGVVDLEHLVRSQICPVCDARAGESCRYGQEGLDTRPPAMRVGIVHLARVKVAEQSTHAKMTRP